MQRLLIIGILFFLVSCQKEDSAGSLGNNSGSYMKFQFKGKSYTITGKSLYPYPSPTGVYASTHSAQVDVFLTNITGVFSSVAVFGESKDFYISFGASKKGDPKGLYTYSLFGQNTSQDIYGGVCHSFLETDVLSLELLLSTSAVPPDVLEDKTDGNKIYRVVPSQSTATVTEANSSYVAGSFDITCQYGTSTQKLTGTFKYVK